MDDIQNQHSVGRLKKNRPVAIPISPIGLPSCADTSAEAIPAAASVDDCNVVDLPCKNWLRRTIQTPFELLG
jgi:hypothetical protein